MRVSYRSVVAGFRDVGRLAALRPGIGAGDLAAAATIVSPLDGGPAGIVSPWGPATNNLEHIVLSDVFGALVPRVMDRATAMRIPAVARARHIIAGTIARIELGDYRGDTRLAAADQAAWIAATDAAMSPFHRMLWTVDDLIFYGWSCWHVHDRSAPSSGGFPLRMSRLEPGTQWTLENGTGRVMLTEADGRGSWRWRVAGPREVVLIPGPHGGLLTEGRDDLIHAADLQHSAHNAARFPAAYLALHNPNPAAYKLNRTSQDPAEVTVETITRDWKQARLNPEGGGVAYLGGLEAKELGAYDAHLLESGRNAAAVDVARHASIPADLIDASVTESSLHYSTSRDNDRRFIDYGLGFYTGAISARMSQNDVSPNGRRIGFDIEKWLAGAATEPDKQQPTAPGTEPAPAPTPDGSEPPA